MYLTGFADEAASGFDGQIRATLKLGWKCIESRNIDGVNLHDIPDDKFDKVCEQLETSGLRVNCFGSAIANWASKLSDPIEKSLDQLRRAIPRMHTLGTGLIRIMSFNVPHEEARLENKEVAAEVIRRLRLLTSLAEDSGVTLVHENCNNWGGRSYEHTLRLLDAIQSPAFRLVFDTGNPVFEKDVRGHAPYRYQDAFEFYSHVKDHIAYVHIKDGRVQNDKTIFTFPGEGDGKLAQILADLHQRSYDGGFSIEPHLAVVAHDASVKSDADIMFDNYTEYGRRFEKMLAKLNWKPGAYTPVRF